MENKTTTQSRPDANRRCTATGMFGCFEAELEAYLEGLDTYDLARLAQSMLSDAQEDHRLGRHEEGRQKINRAKYALDRIARANR